MKIAIIGAGLSGASLYKKLREDKQNNITLFEKSRGAGGRCSTRYVGDELIDHGTPFFEANEENFVTFCEDQIQKDILYKKENIYYPTQGINKICSSQIDAVNICKNTKIVACKKKNGLWDLEDENGVQFCGFQTLFITIPATQVLELDILIRQEIKEKLEKISYHSIATLLLTSPQKVSIQSDLLLKSGLFKKVVNNSEKYNYKEFTSYVIHLKESLTYEKHITNKDTCKKYMVETINTILDTDIEKICRASAHFWKYAFVATNNEEDLFLYDDAASLGFCGDYFQKKDLEGAYQSAIALFDYYKKIS